MTAPLTAEPPRTALRGGPRRAARPGGSRPPGAGARRAPLLPALVFLIVVTQLPFVATLVISFMRWNALAPDDRGFGGLANYRDALADPALRSALLTTVVLTSAVVLTSLLLGLGLALLLDRGFLGRG